jgi:excisionase family DNA binding protein
MTKDWIRSRDVLLTVADVAQRLNMPVKAARNLIYRGQLTAFYVAGKRIRITERHFEEFLRTQVKPA